jgi:hypothetical protein
MQVQGLVYVGLLSTRFFGVGPESGSVLISDCV